MFNYGNLSDVEFEELCRDIMERKLQTHLHTYTRGRDVDFSKGGTIITTDHLANTSQVCLDSGTMKTLLLYQ